MWTINSFLKPFWKYTSTTPNASLGGGVTLNYERKAVISAPEIHQKYIGEHYCLYLLCFVQNILESAVTFELHTVFKYTQIQIVSM